MLKTIVLAAALALVAGAACSRRETNAPAASAPAAKTAAADTPTVETASAPEPPATLTDVNLAAADMGGAVEELTGSYGPGYTGRRLIDGHLDPIWTAPATWSWNPDFWAKYPVEAVFSFYERQPALVGAVTIVLPEAASATAIDPEAALAAPKDVEVWISEESLTRGYIKVAAQTLEAQPGEQTISFPAAEAKFVKLRVLTGVSPRALEIAEVRVLEAARAGYMALFTRESGVKFWKGSPREAAQRGLDWLQQAAPNWPEECFGCHVQAQALMGQAIALKQGYRVSMPALRALADRIRTQETPEGGWVPFHDAVSPAVFGAMGLAQAATATKALRDPELMNAVGNLLAKQAADGSLPIDHLEPPIIQGQFMLTADALVAIQWAATHSKDPKYAQAAERAFSWIALHDPETTQDRVFKIIALMDYGTPEQKRTAWSVVEELSADQQADGGWKEVAATEGSNAFATGQVLYAFKQAGVSVQGEMFRRGVGFLLQGQVNDPTPNNGSWKAMHTQSHRESDFAPTMWAVIGLAGSYGTDPLGALQIVKQGDKSGGRNLEIVLDVSGSMNTRLGSSTRWKTALEVLKEVVDALPEDLKVGLRVYGHRYSSKSAQTCADTELVVPLEKLDRDRILKAASGLRPHGETPLVRSVLQTVGDLKAVGGGSVILITDGEESCQGDPKAAAAKIKASGVDVSLNIVGFTLTGKAVEAQLSALAGSTGGRYYGAQDGSQLSRAVMLAALQRLPYDILDASGKVLVSGQTSELSRELPPGKYRIRIDALGQVLEEPVTIVPDQTTILSLAVEGDRFVIQR